jgi:hypothetical protein
MATVWRLSLNPSKVEAVMTAVGNSNMGTSYTDLNLLCTIVVLFHIVYCQLRVKLNDFNHLISMSTPLIKMKAMSRRLKLLPLIICEGWHNTPMWKALSRPHHYMDQWEYSRRAEGEGSIRWPNIYSSFNRYQTMCSKIIFKHCNNRHEREYARIMHLDLSDDEARR